MPLFEIETDSHIIITWAADEDAARTVVNDSYPHEPPLRVTRRPRDTWVISKAALGIVRQHRPLLDAPAIACPRPPATRSTPSASTCRRPAPTWNARKVIESNMVMGW